MITSILSHYQLCSIITSILLHNLVTSCIHYRNSLLFGVPHKSINKLLQNSHLYIYLNPSHLSTSHLFSSSFSDTFRFETLAVDFQSHPHPYSPIPVNSPLYLYRSSSFLHLTAPFIIMEGTGTSAPLPRTLNSLTPI